MISIITSSINKDQNQIFRQNIAQTIGTEYELLIHDNRETHWGLCKLYNHYAAKSRYDLLCFFHEDILFYTQNWGKELIRFFDEHPKAGVVGFAGTTLKTKHPSGWDTCHTANRIHLIQQFPDGRKEKINIPREQSDYAPVALIDGLALIVPKKVWSETPFDQELFTRFHLYDLDFSMQIAQNHTNYICYTICVEHLSIGSYNREWLLETKKFIAKWEKKLPFYMLPYSTEFIQKHTDLDAYKALKLQLTYTPEDLSTRSLLQQYPAIKTFPYKFKLIRHICRAYWKHLRNNP